MQFFKRILLFGLVNILVIVTLSIVSSIVFGLLGIDPYTSGGGSLNMTSIIVLSSLWGMGGAFISLFISKWIAKFTMGVKIIDPKTAQGESVWLIQTVHHLAKTAGLKKMPEVGYYESPEVNAFATGPSRNNSLVAVSTGLLSAMSKDEAEGVLGHEIAHIANGDMVTMTLIQGVINAFVMIIARVIAFAISTQVKGDSQRTVRFVTTIVLQIFLSFLGLMVVAWFSRRREFRADRGGALYAGKGKMVNALRRLQANMETNFAVAKEQGSKGQAIATLKIGPSKRPGFMHLFSTHPPLEMRIRRLETGA